MQRLGCRQKRLIKGMDEEVLKETNTKKINVS
jgi:hypothetical protein